MKQVYIIYASQVRTITETQKNNPRYNNNVTDAEEGPSKPNK